MFNNKKGLTFRGISGDEFKKIFNSVVELGLSPVQIIEAASYSLAMVVRYALGLSAQGGSVCGLVGDGLAGCVALGTVRHLVNGGCSATIFSVSALKSANAEFTHELEILRKMGVELYELGPDLSQFRQHYLAAHNLICGTYAAQINTVNIDELISLINENHVPVHSVLAPPGLDVDSGTPSANPLYSSSTIALGAPFAGLDAGRDLAGRIYVCDISCNLAIYESIGLALGSLFSEQPVVQIFPE